MKCDDKIGTTQITELLVAMDDFKFGSSFASREANSLPGSELASEMFAVQMTFLTMQSNHFVVMFDNAFMEFPAQSSGEVDSLR